VGEAKRRLEAGLPPKMDQSQMVTDLEVYAVDSHKHRRKIVLDPNGKSAVARAIGTDTQAACSSTRSPRCSPQTPSLR